MNLDTKNIYIVGIKGVAMAGLAAIFKQMGKNVIGSDIQETFITDELLQKHHIKILTGFKKGNVPHNTDLVIYTAAHQGTDNIEVQESLRRKIQTIPQAAAIGNLISNFKNKIAVAGCHGKTTTASLLSYALIKLNQSPSYLVGAPFFDSYPGACYNKREYFVIEADEYGVNPPFDKTPKFHFLNPDYIISTNIDFDHPDIYQDINEVKNSFAFFFQKLKDKSNNHPRLFYCIDDINLTKVVTNLPSFLVSSFGFAKNADLQIANPIVSEQGSNFELIYKGKFLGKFQIALFGEKNISNAAGVILFLLHQGFDIGKIQSSIRGFSGVKRRFEKLAHINNIYLFDDYAHHPREISVVIEAARKRFPHRRVIIIFQPHTFSRTLALKDEFAFALAQANYAFILPIFASAREINTEKSRWGVSSLDLEKIASKYRSGIVNAIDSKRALLSNLKKILKHGDLVFTMGAGDVYKLGDDIIKTMREIANC